jgi:tRNA threonylcarbamoyladenosine biosynthesis protein TsaE
MTRRDTQEFDSRSPDDTRRIAAELVDTLPRRAVLALHGDLGSGKTCFVQGIAVKIGVRQPVTSPTFTIISEYRGDRSALFHVDLYRLPSSREADGIGFDEYIESDGITAIEWAERAADLLPPDTIHIWFEVLPGEDARRIRIERRGQNTTPSV